MDTPNPPADPNHFPHRVGEFNRQRLTGGKASAELSALLEEVQRAREAPRPDGRWQESVEQLLFYLQRYRELFEYAPDGYLVTDLRGVIEEANRTALLMFNSTREFLVGKPLPFLVALADRPAFYARLAQMRWRPEQYQTWEVRLQPWKAPPLDAALTVTTIPDEAGRATGLRWLVRDITPRKKAEEDLRTEKEFVEALLDTAETLVVVLDPRGRVLRVNAPVVAATGLSRAHLLGRDWCPLLIPEDQRALAEEEFRQALAGAPGRRLVCPLVARGGGCRTVAWRGRALARGDGTPEAVLFVGHDITKLEQAQQHALQNERLATIGQVATGLAHESRNALQRAQACLEMLAWKLQGRPDALDLLARMRRAQNDLIRLFEDVREYAAPVQPQYGPCDLAGVWREAWAQVTALAPERDARLEEERAADTSARADCFRMGQVFRNLFENSLAACPDPVRVRVACREARQDGRPALAVAVRDNGPGFPADGRDRLFEPFYTTKAKGTGLGLAIAKRIIEAHGGQITAAPGPGAEVVFTLPRSLP